MCFKKSLNIQLLQMNLQIYDFHIDEESCNEFSKFIIENCGKDTYEKLSKEPYIILQNLDDFTYSYEDMIYLKDNNFQNKKGFRESSHLARSSKFEILNYHIKNQS